MPKAKEKQIAYCGLVCTDCGAFIATKNNDNAKRKAVAAEWTQKYKVDIKPEDINCVGCIVPSGKHIGHWSMCEIHNCGADKGVVNCAYCADYACDKLEKFFQMAPLMKTNLEEIRKGLKK
jgi:hypothetical protein